MDNKMDTGHDRAAGYEKLSARFGSRLQTSDAVRLHHAHSTTWHKAEPPDAVVFPNNTGEVAEIARICSAYSIPIVAFGAGSSLEGHINAPLGGVSIDFSNMAQVIEVVPEDLLAVVQPGVTRERLNEELRATGLSFPIDPGANASLGGMVATRASGTNAVRYGTMAENVLALECVTASGEIIRTGTRARKSAAGFDLTRLIVGSEGTLALITEITLKLRGVPDYTLAGVATFESVAAACDCVISAIQLGLGIGRLELLDAAQIKACNSYSKLDLQEAPTLFFEFAGIEAAALAEFALFQSLLEDCGATSVDWATDADHRSRLWRARHQAYWAVTAAYPGRTSVVTDACVPISRLAEAIEETRADMTQMQLDGTVLGHVGDGNFHVILMVRPEQHDEMARAHHFIDRISERAIRMNGTCTGEHGIGQGKRAMLAREAGASLDLMRGLKLALDPTNILNPGKLFL
ncbi:FAD-binding oxidoreductase [Rhizobium sp. C4]|uniref:FAD-binding oxidoreductase n=1 Tax=Rhizobium sp. C4 TaxID=1349800 RepID=UPI001E2FD9E0|nr:FAD-linked oxidase C-terminal domain-containing protein [Rhizobium sp. C4]MCD2172076.1 FAD-binding protein [Rhizobium sp. C4]